tara:strand:- start:87 stop:233 length:147 start_codon:yes stop_codon:yes gene_type:complete
MLASFKSINEKLNPHEIKIFTARYGKGKIVLTGAIHQITHIKIRSQMG